MAELAFADELELACRYCATFARANSQLIYERNLAPRPEDETGTVTFVRFAGRTYAVTALHVIQAFRSQSEREGRAPESYFLPAGKGVSISPPFVAAPENFPLPAPDAALREIDAGLPAYIGKKAIELRPEARPVYPVAYGAAVGFPTAAKSNRADPLGNRLAMACVHAVAKGVGAPESADQVQFYSEIASRRDVGSLSGMSGGPAFWSDGKKFGLLGFVKEALDIEPCPGEETIYAGPRVNFIVQHATYETFAAWAEHAQREGPRLREELNQAAERRGARQRAE
jgi:hypothetical protein